MLVRHRRRRASWLPGRAALLLLSLVTAGAWAQWCRYESPGVELVTDLAPSEVPQLLRELAALRQGLEPLLPGRAGPQRPLELLLFAERGEFRRRLKARRFSGFMHPSLTRNLLIVGPQRGGGAATAVARHEYAHYLLRNRIGVSLPLWYDEGFANLAETARLDGDRLVLGELPRKALRDALRADAGPAGQYGDVVALGRFRIGTADLQDAHDVLRWPDDRLRTFYNLSWLLVHYLELAQRDDPRGRAALHRFLGERTAPLADYLNTSFPALDRRLGRYLSSNTPTLAMPVTLPVIEARARCLAAVERDYRLAQAMLKLNPKGAARLLRRHLSGSELPPVRTDLAVLHGRALLEVDDLAGAEAAAQRVLSVVPGEPEALTLLGETAIRGCLFQYDPTCRQRWTEAQQLFRRALSGDPDRFDAVFGLGLAYFHLGHYGAAQNYLRVTYRRAPWAPQVNFYLGETLRLTGDSRARRYLERARNWAAEPLWRDLAEIALARLEPEPG